MKILFICPREKAFDSRTVREQPCGGTEKAHIYLGEAFQKLGHEVTWWTTPEQINLGDTGFDAVITQQAELLEFFKQSRRVFWSHHFSDQPITQQQAAEQARLQAEQQLQMQQAQEAAAAQQNMPQMPPAQQPQAPPQMPQAAAMEPAQELQQPGQEGQEPDRPLKKASIEELNSMLAQSQNVQDKLNAMAELAHPKRRVGNAATYELLKREAAADTSAIPPGPQKQQADELRKDALLTLGILNAAQNAVGPTDRLPGIDVIDQVLSDPKTDPSVKIAGIQALQTINRPDDPLIRKILEKAQKDGNPDVKTRAQSALAGEAIPLPS